MLDGFENSKIEIDGLELSVHIGGKGSPLLLLHGYPQTSHIWRLVAPELLKNNQLTAVDLPGYGESQGPIPDAEGNAYSKRNMAKILVALMTKLGFDQFAILGHDRGARVGFRMCLDYPDKITRFAALDIVPTLSVWDNIDLANGMSTFHWFFLAQPRPMPENLVIAQSDHYIAHLLDRWAGENKLDKDAIEHYLQAFRKPETVISSCADYYSGATKDVEHDRIDQKNGTKITCPVLIIYGEGFIKGMAKSPESEWVPWTTNLTSKQINCGHFVAEEAPEECANSLAPFFGNS